MSYMRSAVALGSAGLIRLEQHPRMNLQGSRNASKHLDRWVAFATLYAPEMSHGDSGRLRELRLCQVPILTDPTDVRPDDFFPIRHGCRQPLVRSQRVRVGLRKAVGGLQMIKPEIPPDDIATRASRTTSTADIPYSKCLGVQE